MFSKHRIEALSDAIFAIVMTLLVLDLKVPENLSPGGLLPALMHDSATWASFVLTFLLAATFWTLQHQVFEIARRLNHVHGGFPMKTMRLKLYTMSGIMGGTILAPLLLPSRRMWIVPVVLVGAARVIRYTFAKRWKRQEISAAPTH